MQGQFLQKLRCGEKRDIQHIDNAIAALRLHFCCCRRSDSHCPLNTLVRARASLVPERLARSHVTAKQTTRLHVNEGMLWGLDQRTRSGRVGQMEAVGQRLSGCQPPTPDSGNQISWNVGAYVYGPSMCMSAQWLMGGRIHAGSKGTGMGGRPPPISRHFPGFFTFRLSNRLQTANGKTVQPHSNLGRVTSSVRWTLRVFQITRVLHHASPILPPAPVPYLKLRWNSSGLAATLRSRARSVSASRGILSPSQVARVVWSPAASPVLGWIRTLHVSGDVTAFCWLTIVVRGSRRGTRGRRRAGPCRRHLSRTWGPAGVSALSLTFANTHVRANGYLPEAIHLEFGKFAPDRGVQRPRIVLLPEVVWLYRGSARVHAAQFSAAATHLVVDVHVPV